MVNNRNINIIIRSDKVSIDGLEVTITQKELKGLSAIGVGKIKKILDYTEENLVWDMNYKIDTVGEMAINSINNYFEIKNDKQMMAKKDDEMAKKDAEIRALQKEKEEAFQHALKFIENDMLKEVENEKYFDDTFVHEWEIKDL
jgi:hypothetical protein